MRDLITRLQALLVNKLGHQPRVTREISDSTVEAYLNLLYIYSWLGGKAPYYHTDEPIEIYIIRVG